MDIFAMLQNALIVDVDTDDCVGQAIGFNVVNGRMRIFTVMADEDSEGSDDGAKEDIPEDDASKLEFPKIVAMGKKGADDG
jgi:hypothetical protein